LRIRQHTLAALRTALEADTDAFRARVMGIAP